MLTKSLQGRYQQIKTANATYRTKIKRLADSNVNGLLNVRSRLKEDQLAALCRKSTRGMKWQVSTVRDAIVFKMKMGSKAYSEFVKKVPIYPSERTLQRAVEHMDFDSGTLYDVFHAVKDDIAALPLEQRVCVIGGDEMAIEEAEIYDPGSKKMIGKATFGPHTGLAKKAFTMVLGGVARRYRVTGAYVFTSSQGPAKRKREKDDSNPVGNAYKTMLIEVITAGETIAGVLCEAYISDMGPDNQALWTSFGLGATLNGFVRCSIPHPCRPGARFWFIPDTVHLFKNIITCLSSNQVISLSDDVVAAEGLGTNEVKLQHIQDLLDYEKPFELKVAYRLKQDNLDCNKTFAKMRVSNPAAVFCKRTEAGLRAKALMEETSIYDATIFFVALVTHWFALVTNRAGKMALRPFKAKKREHYSTTSFPNEDSPERQGQDGLNQQEEPVQDGQPEEEPQLREEYIEAINFLRKVINVFRRMKVGKDKKWKPIQRGMLMACTALLEIQEDLLLRRKIFTFLLLGRFTQDFVENLFSLLRFRVAVPNALHFKWNLRVVTLAQICLTANNTNYARDTTKDVLLSPDFLAATKNVAAARSTERDSERLAEEATIDVAEVSDEDFSEMDEWEWLVLYVMAGIVLRSMKKLKNVVTCETCFKSLLWQEEGSHPCSAFLQLMGVQRGRSLRGQRFGLQSNSEGRNHLEKISGASKRRSECECSIVPSRQAAVRVDRGKPAGLSRYHHEVFAPLLHHEVPDVRAAQAPTDQGDK